jgi:hypothetical protein
MLLCGRPRLYRLSSYSGVLNTGQGRLLNPLNRPSETVQACCGNEASFDMHSVVLAHQVDSSLFSLTY